MAHDSCRRLIPSHVQTSWVPWPPRARWAFESRCVLDGDDFSSYTAGRLLSLALQLPVAGFQHVLRVWSPSSRRSCRQIRKAYGVITVHCHRSSDFDCALANPSECRCMATNVHGSCLRRVLRGLDSFRAGNSGSLRTCCMYCHKTTQVSANGLEKLPDSFAILEKELQPVRKQGRRDSV